MFNGWFLSENNTGEKGHLPLSAVRFLLHLLPFSIELCTHVHLVGERKQICAHDYLYTTFTLYAQIGFSRITGSVVFPVSSLERQQRRWVVVGGISGEQSLFGSPCFVLLQDPGTIGTIRHAELFEQQYIVTMEQLRQLLYVLCNRTNGSHY